MIFFTVIQITVLRGEKINEIESKDVCTYQKYTYSPHCAHTAILYRASTGPEQGCPCVNSHREKPLIQKKIISIEGRTSTFESL